MEQRLIDANALMEKMKHRWERFGRESDCICLIEDAPTIEAVPVVHAYWTTKRTWQHDGEIYCSACENDAPTEGDYRQVKTKYCPNCGAIMEGKK